VVDSINLKTPLGEIFLSANWGSLVDGHRNEIRTELYKKTKDASFLDLQKVPKSEQFFVSISHSKSLGGYALHLKKEIGFDVEDTERIKPEIIKRISTGKDDKLFDQYTSKYLWVIKEAAFKLMQGACDVMTEVEVQNFDKIGERSYLGTLAVKGLSADFLCGEVGEASIFALVKK